MAKESGKSKGEATSDKDAENTASKALTPEEIARALQSPEYRKSLSLEQQKALPANPAGDLVTQRHTDVPSGRAPFTYKWNPKTFNKMSCGDWHGFG